MRKFVDLYRGFQIFLKPLPYNERVDGLLYDKDGDKRSLYSLRHTFATLRLEKGDVSIYDLAMNMGCKVAQIENHYSHVLTQQRRHEITKTKRKSAAVVEDLLYLSSFCFSSFFRLSYSAFAFNDPGPEFDDFLLSMPFSLSFSFFLISKA